MLKKILPSLFLASTLLGTGCFVHTHSRGQQSGGCPPGWARNNGGCVKRGQGHGGQHNGNGKDVVIVRDHRR